MFVAGLLLGVAVAGGLALGGSDFAHQQLQPLLARLRAVASPGEGPVGSAPPAGTQGMSPAGALGPEIEVAAAPVDGGFDASASVAVDSVPGLDAQSLRPVDPERGQEMSRAALEGLAMGAFLTGAIDAQDEDQGRRDALNAVLDAFGLPGYEPSPTSDDIASLWLGERGLSTLAVDYGDLEKLRALNHPALLRLRGSDESQTRLVALMQLDGDLASIYGLTGDAPLWVPIDEMLQQWDGEAWVVWNDFESVRPVLAFGEQGHSVAWLQEALAELGYYEGPASGLFDRDTREGLREFQRIHQLQADGMAGPRTRMVLYDLLGRYEVPRLVDPAEVGVSE